MQCADPAAAGVWFAALPLSGSFLDAAAGFRYEPTAMEELVDDFLSYLRNERGQSEHTQQTYAALLGKFVAWVRAHGLRDWKTVELGHLQKFLQHERERVPANQPEGS